MAKQRKTFIPAQKAKTTLEWMWANRAFENKYPALYELLACGLWDGEPRKGATLTLFVSDGRLKACLADRHTYQALWVTLEPFEDILAEVELAAASDKAEWKPTGKNGEKPVF